MTGLFFALSVVFQILIVAMNVNIFKVVILAGTFSLAFAFAGNDLVNFVGVPLAAWDSYKEWSAAAIAPELFTMEGLLKPTVAATGFLLFDSVLRVRVERWFVVAAALAFVVRTFIFEPVRVDGQSMLNTLENNEFMIATKFDYLLGDPERFDIVICDYPNTDDGMYRVKRVIGLPGETIELRLGELYVDGEHVESLSLGSACIIGDPAVISGNCIVELRGTVYPDGVYGVEVTV